MEKSTSNKKRSCPFDEPASRRHSNDDIKALQHDVEELEIRLAAVTRKTIKPTKKLRSVHHHTILQACYQQAQQKINAKRSFSVLPKCGQLEYEHKLDEPVYQRLNKSVALQYEQLAQVFSDAGLNQSRTDYYDARVVTGTQQGTFCKEELSAKSGS
ncbi:uncharacterized protein PHALS_13696 [Plasmopara halstedii]|uniref:Uncharacterized protein n=1 Tax=Plasmopara halstedii TaxID=4781 RepID=A0A0P1AQJ8_PLAHL|nr:uncharacterized protein PHALS_13696 [Plasmopara halstedii]CEG43503.1 hypothetical protein PHALS_13696 [Plasmopara halstedii]|eukprot:XP_024579872.1 hypothetical protein PHALS_13696 [Plasmopara halstedii]